MKNCCRIARYRPHGSHLWVEVFLPGRDGAEQDVKRIVRSILALHAVEGDGISGFAFVVWDRHNAATFDFRVWESCGMPKSLVPDFVRALLTEEVNVDYVARRLST